MKAAGVSSGLGQSAGTVGNLLQKPGQVHLLPVPLLAFGCSPGGGVLLEGLLQVPGHGVLRAPDGGHVSDVGEGGNQREKTQRGWQSHQDMRWAAKSALGCARGSSSFLRKGILDFARSILCWRTAQVVTPLSRPHLVGTSESSLLFSGEEAGVCRGCCLSPRFFEVPSLGTLRRFSWRFPNQILIGPDPV